MKRALAVLAILVTPLGAFDCPSVTCTTSPVTGLVGYWKGDRVLLVADGRVFGTLTCEPWGEWADLWVCE